MLSIPLLTSPLPPVAAATSGTGAPGTNLYLTPSNSLSTTPDTSRANITIPANSGNSVGMVPTDSSEVVTDVVYHVYGAYNGGQTAFNLYVDAGTNVGDAPEVQILYDFNGDGKWDRTETYNYYPTDAAAGWEDYTTKQGLISSNGLFQNFSDGTVEVRMWNAFGGAPVSVGTEGAFGTDGSEITIPVTAPPPTVKQLSVGQTSYPLSVGESNTMHLTAVLSNGVTDVPDSVYVAFSSSDPAVASVDPTGLITAVSPGTAIISAQYGGQTATTTITVNPAVLPGVPQSITQDGQKWNLAWDDEFNGPAGAAPDQYKWTYEIGNGQGGWGNNEQEYYTNSTQNAYLNGNGQLVIQAKKQNMDGFQYTSARLNSQNTGSWRYGIIQVRAKLPAGEQGIWPAIWMMPTNNVYGGWPDSGEIDMMEAVDNHMQNVYGTLHFGAWMGYGYGWSDYDPYRQGAYVLPDNGYHTYSIQWTPNQIKFYVDGNLYATQDAKNWFSGNGQANAPFDQAFHLIMNMAVGGNWPGYPDASTFQSQQMDIDYVRVYQMPKDYAWPIPGRFNASDFTLAKGVTTGTAQDLQYVSWISPTQTNGEAFTYDKDVTYSKGSATVYNVNVTQAGTYEVQYRVASRAGGSSAWVSLDGKPISSVSVPNTGGWQTWETVTDPHFVTLKSGEHILTIVGSGDSFNLHWLRFIPAGPRYVDDFEKASAKWPMGTYTYGSASMVTGIVNGVYDASGTKIAPPYQGNYDVELKYSEGSNGAVSEWYDHPLQNLSPDSGLKVEVYGENTGNEFQVNLEANGHEVFNFVDPNHPTYTFKDNFTGWKAIVLPFSDLVAEANQPDPLASPTLSKPDLTNVYSLDVLAITPNSQGTLYLDALTTYDDSNPSEEPAPETIAPITYQSVPGLINGDSFGPWSSVQTQTTSDTPGIGDGYDVGYIYPGSWMGYFVNVDHTGKYQVAYRVSNGNSANGDIEMVEDGTTIQTTTVPPTGGWTTWQTVYATVNLTAGDHLLQLMTANGNWNLHWMQLTPVVPTLTSLGVASGLAGSSLTLTGTDFGSTQGTSEVLFGQVAATVVAWSDTSIEVTVPSSLSAGTYDVTVGLQGETSNAQTFTVTGQSGQNGNGQNGNGGSHGKTGPHGKSDSHGKPSPHGKSDSRGDTGSQHAEV